MKNPALTDHLLRRMLPLLLGMSFMIMGRVHAQTLSFFDQLSELPYVTVNELSDAHYPEGYYMLSVPLPLDHENPKLGLFPQRVFIGLRWPTAPEVLVTEGYGVDFAGKENYQHELAKLLDANLVVVEHRYFGKSQPSKIDYTHLTLKQSAADIHAVCDLLKPLLTGKWLSTGTSKGGHSAIAHRMYFPEDVAGTVVYGTAIKKQPMTTTSSLLKPLMESPCGMKVSHFQKNAFLGKDSLFPAFLAQVAMQELDFGDMEVEAVLDYILLEYPFAFWQTGQKCEEIPAPGTSAFDQITHLLKVASPKFYTSATRKRWAPAYYMFYHELGYYEYDIAPFKGHLKQTAYPNNFFAPPGVSISFDRRYWEMVRDFLETPAAHNCIFLYGEKDPWALQSVVEDNKYVVPNGSHKSKIKDLPEDQEIALTQRLTTMIGK
ncbi:MAG: S28 family serine protease [Bacteroidia bacterium]